jgi:monovalent cation:H+ antiporter-2, CPA2 family
MGIILLLFVVGMEFPIEKLRRIGKKALTIALSEALGTFSIGFCKFLYSAFLAF